jgi:hypothetical protein
MPAESLTVGQRKQSRKRKRNGETRDRLKGEKTEKRG